MGFGFRYSDLFRHSDFVIPLCPCLASSIDYEHVHEHD
jgi:hypothetical protein